MACKHLGRFKRSAQVSFVPVVFFLIAFGLSSAGLPAYGQPASGVAPPREKEITVPGPGDQALDFTLQDFTVDSFTVSTLTKTKVVLLWFTNLCGGCQSKIASVEKLKSQYEKKGVAVVEVSVLGEDRDTAKNVIRKKNVTFRFLYDPKWEAIEKYSGEYVPGTCPMENIFIIERGGKIAYAAHFPGVDEKELSSHLNEAMKGKQK